MEGCFNSDLQLTCVIGCLSGVSLVSLIFPLYISHRFSMGFKSEKLASQSSTTIPQSADQLLAGATSYWRRKSASPESLLYNLLVDGGIDSVFDKTQWRNTSGWPGTPNNQLQPYFPFLSTFRQDVLIQLSANSQPLHQWTSVACPACGGCQRAFCTIFMTCNI